MGVEFFDLVLGWCGCCSVRCSRSNDFDLYQGFGKGFGVDIPLFIEGLRVGVNGEEGTACGDSGDEGAGSAFVPFEVASAVASAVANVVASTVASAVASALAMAMGFRKITRRSGY